MTTHPPVYSQGHNKPWYHSATPLKVEDPDLNHPDSNYWQSLARGAMDNLAKVIGSDAYKEWAEQVWPGETIDNYTWMQIYDHAQAAYRLAKWDGVRDIHKLAEAARNA